MRAYVVFNKLRWGIVALALALTVLGVPAGAPQDNAGIDVAELVRSYAAAVQRSKVSDPQAGVLVSFGMPTASLRILAQDAARAGVPLLLRGLVANNPAQTWHHILAVDPAARAQWLVDPRPFRELAAQAVPVFLVWSEGERRVVRGDVTLAYALARLAHTSDELGKKANALLRRLEPQQ